MLGPLDMQAMQTGAASIAFDAYRRCNGDVNAITDFLMETVMADTVRQLEDSPPLDFDGTKVAPVDALRELLRLQVRRVAALIEEQGQPHH